MSMGSHHKDHVIDKIVSHIDTLVKFGQKKIVTTLLSWGKHLKDYQDGLLMPVFSAVLYSAIIIGGGAIIAACLGVTLLLGSLITLAVLMLVALFRSLDARDNS